MDLEFNGGKVSDAVTIRYAFSPLTFHHGAWIVTKMLPYIEDLCWADSKQCGLFIQYVSLAFENQPWILAATDMSYNQIVDKWAQTVADNLKLDVNDLKAIYDYGTDTHNSEMRTRYMWKYTASRAVGGTPSAFVNGIRLVKIPNSAD